MTIDLDEIITRNEEEAEEDEGTETEPETDTDGGGTDEPEDHAHRVAEAEQAIDMQEREKQLRREDTRHENALKKVYGEDFALRVRCIVCDGEGFVEQSPELLGILVQLGDDAREALGGANQGLRQDPTTQTCEVCAGAGQLLTGSTSDHTRTRPCKTCNAQGYIDLEEVARRERLGVEPQNGASGLTFPVFHENTTASAPADGALRPPDGWHASGMPGADQWSRWPGHPRYGVDPSAGGGW